MACDSDSLLLLHVAPCSFNPVGSSQDLSPVVAAVQLCDAVHGAGVLPAVTSHTSEWQQHRKATSTTGEQARVRGQGASGSSPDRWAECVPSLGPQLTRDPEAAGIEGGALGGGDIDFQAELLQGPAVGLGHVLPGGGDVRFGDKQAAQAHVDVLWEEAAPRVRTSFSRVTLGSVLVPGLPGAAPRP